NELAIGRVIRAVIESRGSGEPRLGAACDWNRVDVEFTMALAAVDVSLPIGRPAVPIRRTERGEATGRAAGGRQDINEGMPLLRLVAEGQQRPVWRKAVVVVAADGKSRVDRLWFASRDGQAVKAAFAVEKECGAIA